MESAGKAESVVLCDFYESLLSCCLSLQCQIFLLSLPSAGMRQDLLCHSNYLELQILYYILLLVFAMMLSRCS